MAFTVFAKPRPVRTAFLVDSSAQISNRRFADAVLDGIVSFCNSTWGGHLDPLVVVDPSGAMSTDSWDELLEADVDEIYASCPISESLVKELDARVLPWNVRGPDPAKTTAYQDWTDDHWPEVPVSQDGVAIPPIIENLRKIEKQNLFLLETGNKNLLLFEFSSDCSTVLRRFLHRNFGTYYQWIDSNSRVRRLKWFEDHVPSDITEVIPISDLGSICRALDLFAGTLGKTQPKGFIAPCELNALGLGGTGSTGYRFQHIYRIVVGSTVEDFAFFWNSCRIDNCWRVPFRDALWVPRELTLDEAFLGSLRNWLTWRTYQGNSNRRDAEFMSLSLPESDLNAICGVMRQGLWGMVSRVRPVEQWYQAFRQELSETRKYRRPMAILNGNNAQRLVASSGDQTLSLAAPEVVDANALATWAVDVQVEIESRSRGRTESAWWFLPRRTGRGIANKIFGEPARINCTSLFSVKIRQDPGLVMRPTAPN